MMLLQAQSRVAKQLTSPGRLSNTGKVSDVHNERQDFWLTVQVQQYVNVFKCVNPWLDIFERKTLGITYSFSRAAKISWAGTRSDPMSIPFYVQMVPILSSTE